MTRRAQLLLGADRGLPSAGPRSHARAGRGGRGSTPGPENQLCGLAFGPPEIRSNLYRWRGTDLSEFRRLWPNLYRGRGTDLSEFRGSRWALQLSFLVWELVARQPYK